MITHSALIVFLVCLITRPLGRDVCSMASWGAAIGLAAHLLPDMFPSEWTGFAFIYVPILGRLHWIPLDGNWIPIIFSFSWLGLSVLMGFFIAAKARGED